jgi:hypothetical protein
LRHQQKAFWFRLQSSETIALHQLTRVQIPAHRPAVVSEKRANPGGAVKSALAAVQSAFRRTQILPHEIRSSTRLGRSICLTARKQSITEITGLLSQSLGWNRHFSIERSPQRGGWRPSEPHRRSGTEWRWNEAGHRPLALTVTDVNAHHRIVLAGFSHGNPSRFTAVVVQRELPNPASAARLPQWTVRIAFTLTHFSGRRRFGGTCLKVADMPSEPKNVRTL